MAKQAKAAAKASSAASGATEDAVALLSADHRKVESLFEQYKSASTEQVKSELAHKICSELNLHTLLEEEIFYPACRNAGVEQAALDEAQVEHDGAKVLIRELTMHQPGDEYYDAKVTVLCEYIQEHVAEEERADEGIFAKAQDSGVDMQELGKRIKERKAELQPRVESPDFRPLAFRSLGMSGSMKERDMDRQYERDRDEQGRFVSDDESRGRYRGGYGSRGREDDDYGHSGRSSGRGWYGDSEGHSRASEEGWQRRGGGYSGRGRDYEDDDRRYGGGGGRGQGGWFGDPEGHSRASEEGWEQRRGGGYSGRGPDYEDDGRRYGGGRGRSHGGWFGDPEGHSRASEEGWEHRRGGGGGGYSGRGRDYEDDDRRSGGSRGRGHGGWFGDPEGHSRASEEGWEHRGSRYSRDR